MKSFTTYVILMIILLELWVCKIGLLKTKEVSVLLSIVLFLCCALLGLFFLFVWLFCFGYGMDEVMMY